MAAKQKAKPTFLVKVRHGTPHHLDDKAEYSSTGQALKWLLSRVSIHQEWAKRYNFECAAQLADVRIAINDLDLRALHVGEVRRWEAGDDLTNVAFVFEVELVSR